MNYPCIENTINFIAGKYKIRLWINQTEPPKNYSWEVDFVNHSVKMMELWKKKEDIIQYLSSIKNINAFEIQEEIGSDTYGTVFYTVDFTDPHG